VWAENTVRELWGVWASDTVGEGHWEVLAANTVCVCVGGGGSDGLQRPWGGHWGVLAADTVWGALMGFRYRGEGSIGACWLQTPWAVMGYIYRGVGHWGV